MDCVVTPLKTLMGFSVHLNVQLKFYNLPLIKGTDINKFFTESVCDLRETYRCYSTKAHSPGRVKSNQLLNTVI